jgi:mannose-1-phosphate guanylyltransferase
MQNDFTRLAVIMAGGSGERFWPLSRGSRPKQLLHLTSPSETMLEEAVRRIEPLVGKEGVFVSTSAKLAEPIAEHGVVSRDHVLSEPAKRNTLGALVWSIAELIARGHNPDTTSVAVLTADHAIRPAEAFRECVASALALGETEGGIVTIGIRPTRPETGYGYVEAAMEESHGAGYRGLSFREKPDAATAESFLEAGSFLWNSGMFFFTLAGFLSALATTQPASHTLLLGIANHLQAGEFVQAKALFEELPNLSIDYAVMEKAPNVFVVPSCFEWDDLGAWDALDRSYKADSERNVSKGEVVIVDSSDSIVYNDTAGTVAVLGMTDVVVVATEGAMLVCPKSQAQRVKEIVQALAARDQS